MKFKIEIQGRTPLMCNRFGDAAADAATTGNRLSTIGEKGTPKEQAEGKLYLDLKGRVCIPQPNLFRCLIDAGIFFKAGKSKLTTQKSSLIPACVEVEGVTLPIISKGGWETDTRPVRIPSTGGADSLPSPDFPRLETAVQRRD